MLGCSLAALLASSFSDSFDPLTRSPAVWYKFSDASTLYKDAGVTLVSADGDLIYQVNDKSGNNRHLTQATSTKRPTYKVNIQNGKSVGMADGGDVMQSTSFTLAQPHTAYCVFKVPAAVTNNETLYAGVTSAYGQNYITTAGTYGMYSGTARTFGTSSTATLVTCAVFNGASSEFYANGGSDLIALTPGTGSIVGGLFLFAGSATPSFPIQNGGWIGEYILTPVADDTTQRTQMMSYLGNDWGVTIS